LGSAGRSAPAGISAPGERCGNGGRPAVAGGGVRGPLGWESAVAPGVGVAGLRLGLAQDGRSAAWSWLGLLDSGLGFSQGSRSAAGSCAAVLGSALGLAQGGTSAA